MALLFDKGLWIILNNQDRILERCCSDVSLTSSCSTMEWRQTSEQLIAPELAPQQSINSTTEEKVVFFVFGLRTVPLTLSSHYAVARWRFSLMTSSVLESRTWSVCAWTPQPVGGCLPWLDVSAGLQRSSFGLVDSVACEHFTSCSNSAMQYWAKHTCREGQSFLKRFPLKTADAMRLWNYETFGTVTVIQPDTDAAAPLQSSCQLSAEPSTVSCWPADCKHRLENVDLGCFKQCADFPLKWEVVFF